MTDYINALVPVSNGDANNNYPWMQIRAGGTQTTASRFGELSLSGSGQFYGRFRMHKIVSANATAQNITQCCYYYNS